MSETEETLNRKRNSEKGRIIKFYKGYREGRMKLDQAILETEKLRNNLTFKENEDFLEEAIRRLKDFKNG